MSMIKKRRKRRKKIKLRKSRILLLVFIFSVFFFYDFYLSLLKIQNIYVVGNRYLKDQEVIEIARLQKYPNFYFTLSKNIKKNLIKSDLIYDAKVKKKFWQVIEIEVIEEEPILIVQNTNEIILKSGKKIPYDARYFDTPILTTEIDSDCECLDLFFSELSKINRDILTHISEIRYEPIEDIDKKRFLLLMNDTNQVYINLYTFSEKINNYNSFLEKLGGQRGYIYLDVGNQIVPYE